MNRIKVLVLTNSWPQPTHTSRAANVVFFEMIRELSRQRALSVAVLKVSSQEPDADEGRSESLAGMEQLGVTVLPEIKLPPPPPGRPRWKRLLRPSQIDFHPEVAHTATVRKAVDAYKPDLLLIPWSEMLTAICADFPHKKFAYYGNPDSKPQLAMLDFQKRHGEVGELKYAFNRYQFENLRKLHLQTINKYEIVGDVAANDADFYLKNGIERAFYIQNIWIDRFPDGGWRGLRNEKESDSSSNIIIGNIGKLGATANTHGLELLGKEILPALREKKENLSFEMHLLGRGKIHPSLVNYFEGQPDVKIRGFIDDIDSELLRSQIFLCANNGSNYNVGHTRYLHAWSLGCCVVAHANASLAMPEIKHGENALLGKDSKEIASLILLALKDSSLRKKLGENGYQTFQRSFTAQPVAAKISERILSAF